MKSPVILGWREWILLPKLCDMRIKAKVDTGAKTSCLHTFYIERYRQHGADQLKFRIHPLQGKYNPAKNQQVVECHAPLLDVRDVTDSGGHREQRFVIETEFCIGYENTGNDDSGEQRFDAELTLTDRDPMLFRMLLGRNALQHRFLVDPAHSFLLGGNKRLGP
jgi:hypothetical protein